MDLVTQQKLERRERILEAARELIAGRGYDGLTMRELAAHCRVSVPTLYNQFGSKDALLAAAVEAHFSGLLDRARGQSWRGQRRLIGVAGLCADEVVRLPRYHRALIRAFMGTRDTTSIQATLVTEMASEIERGLLEMSERRQLARWASPEVLSRQITAAAVAASVAWVLGALSDRELRAANVHAAASMVLGAARGSARAALEREVRSAQTQLAGVELPRLRRRRAASR